MKFSYNWLQSYFKEKLPKPEKLAEFLTMRSFEVEAMEKAGADYLLDIAILPNRFADCASHFGVARECAALLNYKLQFQKSEPKRKQKLRTKDYIKLYVKEPDLCPRYIGFLIRNVKVGKSPEWLQKRLMFVGQRPINNIVDITNYVMLETGQPLHAFDLEKLGGREIVVRLAKEGEKITTLDDKLFELKRDNLLIADRDGALAIAGIKGGKKAEITGGTKDIILEAAVFNPTNIRNTSRSLVLKTDASIRFEQGISLFLPEIAIERTAVLIQEITGGEAAKDAVDFRAKKLALPDIVLNISDFGKLTGLNIDFKTAEVVLKSLGFEVKKSVAGKITVIPPAERLDISIKEDVIEEVVRVYGYDKVFAEVPQEILIPPARNDEYFYANSVRDILTGLSFSEVYNYSLAKNGDEKLRLKNPISMDRAYLRENLSESLGLNVLENFKYFDEVKIFEIGKVFYPLGLGISEETMIAGAVSYKNQKKKEKEVFYELKGAVETMLHKLGIEEVWFKEGEKIADVLVGQQILGYITKDSFELSLKKIIELSEEDQAYHPVSRYPAVTRDLAIFVPYNIKVDEVMDVIENTAGELLIDTDLFDIYEPEDDPSADSRQARKSLAFHLIWRSKEKTLTDEEVNGLMAKIIKVLEQNSEWEVRK